MQVYAMRVAAGRIEALIACSRQRDRSQPGCGQQQVRRRIHTSSWIVVLDQISP